MLFFGMMPPDQPTDGKYRQYPHQHSCRIDAHIPDLAGSARYEILVQFIGAGIQDPQREGKGDFLQAGGIGIQGDGGAEQNAEDAVNQKMGTFPQGRRLYRKAYKI